MTTPKKATARKAATATAKKPAVKKAVKKAAPKAAVKKTVVKKAPVAGDSDRMLVNVAPKPVTVHGRKIMVKMPTGEQLMILEETLTEVASMEGTAVDYESMKTVLRRYYKIMSVLFLNQKDRDWLDDGRLDGTITLFDKEILQLPVTIIELFKDEFEEMGKANMNRAQRRAASRKAA